MFRLFCVSLEFVVGNFYKKIPFHICWNCLNIHTALIISESIHIPLPTLLPCSAYNGITAFEQCTKTYF